MELFEANTKSSSGISGVLNEYYETVKGIDTTTQDIFGEGNPSKLSMLQKAFLEYSSQTPEDLKMRSVDYTPSPEKIAEARRQKEEVKAKWTNPDGSIKKGYMLAPNGKPTKLTEDQWLIVRTPNFKRWFGDWEKEAWAKAAMDFLEKTESVASLTGQEFQKDGVKLTDKVSAYFNSIGNVAHNEELGDVVLDLKGVEDSLGHGMGRLKAAAFMAVKDVIEKGFIFNRETNWKGRGWNTAVITAPIKIGTKNYICEVVVKKINNSQRFYLHEVETKETLGGVFKSVANNGNASQVSRLILGKHLAEVNGKVSKVVDENGEPLVVYHGTRSTSRFNVFKGSEHFFSDNREVADGFLNGNDYALEINGETYPISRRDMEALADIIMGDSAEYDSLVGDWEAGELSYEGASEIISDITHNEYTVEALSDFPLSIKVGGRIVEAFLNIRNPIEIDYGGKTWQAGKVMPEQDLSEHPNADGLIGRNIREGGLLGELRNGNDFPISTDYVVRNSNQIKSATDNVGTFSNSPDIRWREVEESSDLFERLKNIEGEFVSGRDLKKVDNLKYYFDYFKNNLLGKEIKTPIGKFAYFNLGHFNKLVARGKNKGESEEVSSLNEWIDKIESNGVDLGKNPPKGFDYARACSMPLVIDVLKNPQFILIDTDDTLMFVKKYGEKEYFWCSVMNNGETLGIKSWRPLKLTKTKCGQLKIIYTKKDGVVNLAQPRESQRLSALQNNSKNQEKNDIRELERQERGNNPLVWASIVLAKDVLNGRQITQARLEKLLPGYKLDGSKYEYVKDRAQKIAETCRAKYLNAKRDIDLSLQLAESDYYWNSEQMEKIYDSFRKDGEAYGEAKQKIIAYLRAQKDKKLKDVKGYEAEDFKHNLVDSILQAMETEPKPPARESAEERMLSA